LNILKKSNCKILTILLYHPKAYKQNPFYKLHYLSHTTYRMLIEAVVCYILFALFISVYPHSMYKFTALF